MPGIGFPSPQAGEGRSEGNIGARTGSALHGRPHRRIGLLGGSFNPAPEGHLHISLMALRRLELDEVAGLAAEPAEAGEGDGAVRRTGRRRGLRRPSRASGQRDRGISTTYTANTITALERRFLFVWLMGGDSLAQLPRWERWVELMGMPMTGLAARSPGQAAQFSPKPASRPKRRGGSPR